MPPINHLDRRSLVKPLTSVPLLGALGGIADATPAPDADDDLSGAWSYALDLQDRGEGERWRRRAARRSRR